MTYTARTPSGAILTVRPMHPALYLLGLGHRLSPIGLGRVVHLTDPDRPDEPFYVGDGPSIGWVNPVTAVTYWMHDLHYRSDPSRSHDLRRAYDEQARRAAEFYGERLRGSRLAWWLATPLLRLAWHFEWGGWNDLPRWLWWPVLAAWAALVWGVPVGAIMMMTGG